MFLDSKWKDKFPLVWCSLCESPSITCPDGKHASCNGGSCDKCSEAFKEFHKGKITVEEYLTSEEEVNLYHKTLRIKHFIMESLEKGETEINFKKLHDDGQMSQNDEDLFSKELQR